jgi:hypothetical protein
MIDPKLLMHLGFAISLIGHAAVLSLALIFAGANPFDAAPTEAIAVDIVTADEIKPPTEASARLPEATSAVEAASPTAPDAETAATSPAPPKPHPSPEGGARQAQPQSQPIEPVRPPQSSPPAAEPPETNIADMFGLPLALPDGRLGGGFDAPAIDRAKISAAEIAAFREHLKTCLRRPGSVAPTDKLRVVLRVVLKPDRTLAATPTLIEASASAKGPALMESAISGLRACQPYAMLPLDKYKEWKVLDLSFTPQDFAGG